MSACRTLSSRLEGGCGVGWKDFDVWVASCFVALHSHFLLEEVEIQRHAEPSDWS